MKTLVGILLILASLISIGFDLYYIFEQIVEYGELYNYSSLWYTFYHFVFVLVGIVLVFDKKGN